VIGKDNEFIVIDRLFLDNSRLRGDLTIDVEI
jgi:hypothetical protein